MAFGFSTILRVAGSGAQLISRNLSAESREIRTSRSLTTSRFLLAGLVGQARDAELMVSDDAVRIYGSEGDISEAMTSHLEMSAPPLPSQMLILLCGIYLQTACLDL